MTFLVSLARNFEHVACHARTCCKWFSFILPHLLLVGMLYILQYTVYVFPAELAVPGALFKSVLILTRSHQVIGMFFAMYWSRYPPTPA